MKLLVKLDSHQIDAVKFICDRRRSLLAYATGTGKSLCLIASSILLIKMKKVEKSLFIVTPNAMIEVQNDFSNFTDCEPKVLDNVESIVDFINNPEELIGITKYSVFNPSNSYSICNAILGKKIALFFDEAHEMKNPSTIANRSFTEIIPYSHVTGFATATAITAKLEDLYHIINLLYPQYLGSLSSFIDRYIVRTLKTIYRGGGIKRKVWETLRYKNLEVLHNQLNDIVISFYPKYDIKSEVVSCELNDITSYMKAVGGVLEVKRRGKKKNNEEDEISYESEKSAKQHSVRMSDAQFAVNNDKNKIEIFKKLITKISDIGCVVYAYHHDSIELLSEALTELEIEHYKITGEVSQKNRAVVKKNFTTDSRNKVLLITSGGGQSLNLQSTNRIVFYDIPFGIGKYIQVLGRVSRYYSSFNEFEVYYVTVKDTIDDYKLNYITQNSEPIRKVLNNEIGSNINMLFSDYNDYVLRKLKNQYLWQKKVK